MTQQATPLPWLAMVLALLVAGPAWAQEATFASVERITEPDPTGRYRTVEMATRGNLTRGAEELPLTVGMDIQVGDVIELDAARVQLRKESSERVLLGERSRVAITGERSLTQTLGEVYYRLRDTFRVQYGTVETVVEGTRFVVIGSTGTADAPVQVRVDQGRVTVKNATASVPVRRGQQAALPQTGGEDTIAESSRLSRSESWRTFSDGRPRLVLQAMATGSALVPYAEGTPSVRAAAGSGGVRIGAGVALGRWLRLTTATSVSLNGSQRLRLPQELGLAVALPGAPITFGGGPELTWEQCIKECGGSYKAVHLGGTGWVQGTLIVGPRFGLIAEARASVGDVVRATGGLGVEVSL